MKIVNRHHHRGEWPNNHFYVGRHGRIAREEIARGAMDATIFGNPFTVREHGDEALELYRRHLYNALKDFPEIRHALLAMPATATLICQAAPMPCHGDVIASAWEWMFRKRRRLSNVHRSTRWIGQEVAA